MKMKNALDEHSDAAFFTRFGLVLFVLGFLAMVFWGIGYAVGKRYEENDPDRVAADADKHTAPFAKVITSNEQLASLTPPSTSQPAAPKSGEQIVGEVCGACHNAGLLGAPKAHDKAAWQQRLKTDGGGNVDGLVAVAEKGKGSMPPKGGQPSLSTDDLKKAIQFMMN
jgi:cytochrome c5